MSDRIRTALFGGTFNPLHTWKKDQALLDDRLRYDMVAQAVKDLDGVRASNFEFKLDKPSYTANTLRRISAEYPDREFVITIGADNWVKFHNWKEADFIQNNYPIIVYPRQGYPIESLSGNVTLLDYPLMDISSTRIRQMVQDGTPINELVPTSVARTIKEKGLYL